MARPLPQTLSRDELPPLPELYILWHPECAHGAAIAWQIRQWLRPAAGQGPQIFYRGEPAPTSGARLPLPLPGEKREWPPELHPPEPGRTLQIVIPLLDHHMVADPAWRWWLEHLSAEAEELKKPQANGCQTEKSFRRIFLPVALTRTAFNAPAAIAKQNFLRIPDVLDLEAKSLWVEPLQSLLLSTLLKPLTEALCNIVLDDSVLGQTICGNSKRRSSGRGVSAAAHVRPYMENESLCTPIVEKLRLRLPSLCPQAASNCILKVSIQR